MTSPSPRITKHGMPLIRYRTHDLCTLTDEPCPCGRTHVRMGRVMGRTDDMLIIRGVNVFPSQIEHALLQVHKGIRASLPDSWCDRVGTLPIPFEVQVEMTPELFSDTVTHISGKEEELENALKAMLGIHAKVHLVAPKAIARSEGKAVRVIDRRHLQ